MTSKNSGLFVIAAIAVLGTGAWLGIAGWLGAKSTPQEAAAVVTRPQAAPGELTGDPRNVVGQPTLDPAPGPSVAPNGLHVLCPVKGGGHAHLLLTAQTYYKAVTPEEEARLTELLGPPVTNVDPRTLPPKSPTSVTDALDQLAPGG